MKKRKLVTHCLGLFLLILALFLVGQLPAEALLGKTLSSEEAIRLSEEIETNPPLLENSHPFELPLKSNEEDDLTTVKEEKADGNVRATKWDLSNYRPLPEAPFFKDATLVSEPLDAEYTFNLSRSQETEIIGAAIHPTQGSGQYAQIDAMNPGDVFYVTNVGYYKGESIDLQVTINSFYKNPISPNITMNIMFTKEFFTGVNFLGSGALNTPGNYIDLTYTTVKSGTTEEIATNGVLPYNNVSTSGMFSLSSNTIEHVYGAADSVVKYASSEEFEGISFGSLTPTGVIPGTKPPERYPAPFDPVRQVTTVYKELTTRRFRYESKDGRGGFTMDQRSTLPIDLPQPDVSGNEYPADQEMHYKIRQYIPLEPKTHLFTNFFIELPLAKVLQSVELTDITVTGNDGYELSADEFAVHVDDSTGIQRLNIEILPVFREKNNGNDFYGNYLTVKVPVAVDYKQDLSEYETADRKIIRVPLKATTKIDKSFYGSVTSEEGAAEATNEGKMTIYHVDEQGRSIIDAVSFSDVMGTKWSEPYVNNGGYDFVKLTSDDEIVENAVINGFDQLVKVVFDDERYKLGVTASTPDDATGATAKEEATITYRIELTSQVEKSYVTPETNDYQQVKITLNDYATELLEPPHDGQLQLKDGTVIGTATYNATDHSYESKLTTQGISWEEDLVLVFNATVRDGIAAGSQIQLQPTVELAFSKSGLSYFGEAALFSTEIVKTQLAFLSHPTSIDFGEIKRLTYGGERVYPIKKMNTDLVVKDDRVGGNSWKVTAMLTKELTTTIAGVDHSLPSSLKYKKGNSLTDLLLNQKVPIYTQSGNGKPLTNISQRWLADEEGIVLQLATGKAKKSDYSATILWELEDAY